MVEFARHFTTILRVTHIILLSLIILTNIVVFILSVVQANNPNVADEFPSPTINHWGYNKDNTSCAEFDSYPLRFMYASNATLAKPWEYCPWTSRNTWWRSVSMIFLLIGAALMMGIVAKKSPANNSAAIWQDPKNVLRALMIPAGISGVNMFLLMCFDAGAVNVSQTWCDNYAGSMASIDAVTCDYTPFVVTTVFDFLLTLFWGLVTLFLFIRQMKKFRQYQEFQDEVDDSHEMLEHSSSGWKKKGGKSWVDKHLKKAKDRMRGRK